MAPSLTPGKPGDRVKTDARDLALSLRADTLIFFRMPSEKEESVRIIYHIINIKRSKGLAVIEIKTEAGILPAKNDPIQKLRDLEALNKVQRISSAQYERKRREILNEKW